MDLLWMSAYPSCLAVMVSKAAHLEYQCRKKNLRNPPNRFSFDWLTCVPVSVFYEICLSWFLYLKIFSEPFLIIKNTDWLQCFQNGTWSYLVELLRWKALKWDNSAVNEWDRVMELLLLPPSGPAAYVCSCCLNWRARCRKNLKACIENCSFPNLNSVYRLFSLKCEKIEMLNYFNVTVQYGRLLLTETLDF